MAHPRPSLDDVQQRVGAVSSALFAVRDLSRDARGDSPGFHFGALAGILAEQLDSVWVDLDRFVASAALAVDADDQEP